MTWNLTGLERPDFAVAPAPGQESVWDYPRPPAAEPCSRLIEVRHGNTVIARATRGYRLLETASPPTFYLPPESVRWDSLVRIQNRSVCEWKGEAHYWKLADNTEDVRGDLPVAWSYPRPRARYAMLKDMVSFYPARLACFVDGERVTPQAGRFYGGWITADVVGPFKGEPGTGHW